MMKVKLKKLIESTISGEWGVEDTTGDGVNIIRGTNFGRAGRINYSNLTKRLILKKDKEGNFTIDHDKLDSKKLLNEDIIIEKSGGGPNTPVGRVVYFEEKEDGVFLTNNFTTLVRANKKLVNPKFLFYQFSYLYLIGKVKKYQNKTVGLYNLKINKYLNEEVTLPEVTEQSKVVVQLNRIQHLIDYRIQSIDLLNRYLESLFFEMFGDPVLNEKKWNKVKLNEIGEIITGNTPPKKKPEYYSNNEKGIDWIKSDNIKINNFYNTKAKERLTTKGETVGRTVPKNSTLIISISGSKNRLGDCCMTIDKVAFNQQINAFVPLKNSIYHYFLLKNSKHSIQNLATNALKKLVSKTTLEKMTIIDTDDELQIKFEEIFSFVQTQKNRYQKSLELLETLFHSLLHKTFSNDSKIDEDKIFEDLLRGFTNEQLKENDRLIYMINWLNKNQFSSLENYNVAIKKLFDLLEQGEIKQYLSKNTKIKIKKS
ncbi:hypothetical protein [Zobellia uliginosa]|uniref:hypothetical protein n=1 Tax=Zobellia uliginosa TaxID=143224 RepID=UPI001C069E39|nr:hypothetical protein [Zobellia uliginosa]MBU2946603.1 hypothetical protein [Zobellia uliginosa]